MMPSFVKTFIILILFTSLSSLKVKAQNYIEDCELSTTFSKQISKWNSRFRDKTQFEFELCEHVIGQYTKCVKELNNANCTYYAKDSLLIYLHKMLGNSYRYLNDNYNARKQYENAIEISNRCNKCNIKELANINYNMAVQKRLLKDFSAAERYFLAYHNYKLSNGVFDCDVPFEMLTTYEYAGYPIGHPKLDSIYNLVLKQCDKSRKIDVNVNYQSFKHIQNKNLMKHIRFMIKL